MLLIVRFFGVDQLTEKYIINNRPVNLNLKDGRDIWKINKNGEVVNYIHR